VAADVFVRVGAARSGVGWARVVWSSRHSGKRGGSPATRNRACDQAGERLMINGEIPCGSARPRWSLLTLAASALRGAGVAVWGAALVAGQAAIALPLAADAGRGCRRPAAMSASNGTRRVTMACSQRSRVAAQAARACPSLSRLRSRPVKCA
jgi:hypothetical protein